MKIPMSKVDEIFVARLPAELDGAVSPVIQQQLLPIAKDVGQLVIDMTDVQYISSSGLHLLLSVHRHCAASGGRLAVIVPDRLVYVQETLEETGFGRFLTVCKTVAEGVNALKAGTEPPKVQVQ